MRKRALLAILPRVKFSVLLLGAITTVAWAAPDVKPPGVEWNPEVNMDHQLYPSLLIATASVRPVEDEDDADDTDKETDPYLLGDEYSPFGVSINLPTADATVKVTLKENNVLNASSWSGPVPEKEHDYYIAPKIDFKYDKLRAVLQQVPLNVSFEVEVNGKSLGTKVETVQLHSINDCPYGVANTEETVDDENVEDGSTDLGFMFAAYVNEDHPLIDKILKEALATRIVDNFSGYQAEDPAFTVKQVFAIWAALQKRGIKYSSVTEVPGGSHLVNSQYVRFIEQSVNNAQANCVDGSVLFASILRKIGLKPYLVAVPGHMYLGFHLDTEGDDTLELETTVIGSSDESDDEENTLAVLDEVADQLDDGVREGHAWTSFAAAVNIGTTNFEKVADKLNEGDPEYQAIDIAAARDDGIMPISYVGKSAPDSKPTPKAAETSD